MKNLFYLSTLLLFVTVISCKNNKEATESETAMNTDVSINDTVQTAIGPLVLPKPYATESARNGNKLVDWPEGKMPIVPEGFTVTKYVEDLKEPRWTYVGENGDMFVAESKKDRIIILRDANNDGEFEVRETFLDGLDRPFGMLIIDNTFYVANQSGVVKYSYKVGQTSLNSSEGKQIVDLPADGYNNHWTRNIITNKLKNKLYISVGSASNVGEHGMDNEIRRANILETDLDGNNEKVFANGLRNPVGMDWNPTTGELWTAVNERDELGDNLVPDYITSVEEDGFYGWPYSYFGQLLDPRLEGKGADLVAKAIIPDVPLGSHTASLGLAFNVGNNFPERYRNGAFVGQHGSWNRAVLSGYRVVFVPFIDGKPAGQPEDFLSGFISDLDKSQVYGRPVGVTFNQAGDLLINDDSGGIIWKVSALKK